MNKVNLPNRKTLYKDYEKQLPQRRMLAGELEKLLEEILKLPSPPRVKGRVKSFDSYFKKYIRLLKNNSSGSIPEIYDLIGVRIICPFLDDLVIVEEIINEKFKVVETDKKGRGHANEFGYESIHLLVEIPDEIRKAANTNSCKYAEFQIRTILQDVWAEVEHELIYKVEFTPFDAPLRRKLAAINASLSMADILFQDVRSYQRKLNGEMGKRRDSFFQKIEESSDAFIFQERREKRKEQREKNVELKALDQREEASSVSMDDLLLDALSAHNDNLFDEAIAIYSKILETNHDNAVRGLVYKHRGMAHFACSGYEEAIADFSESLKLDPTAYKAAYYQGIACSVLQRYSQALDAFNQSLKINPYQPYCLFRRGQVYFHINDYPQALGDCEAALSLESFEAAQKFKDLLLTKLKM